MKETDVSKKDSEGDFERDAGGTGTTFGAAGGAIVGGVLGSLGGPGGTVIGALAGAAAGGVVGHVIGAGGWADSDEKYWQENLPKQPFYQQGFDYADYAEALRLGYQRVPELQGKSYEESESRLIEEWERVKGSSRLTPEQARQATRAAWEHASNRG
jgi:hypothetical protein